MKRVPLFVVLFLEAALSVAPCLGQAATPAGSIPAALVATSAFEALRLLPPDVARRIALIEGRDGDPVPQRWYLVVYDPSQEHHLSEYVVVRNRVVAARTISQFAQELSADDIIPTDSPLLNSDRVWQLVQQFAQANNMRVPKLNYELRKEGAGAVPLWKVSCLGETSTPFAYITLAAANGTIVRTEGFNFAPNLASLEPPPVKQEPEDRLNPDSTDRGESLRQVSRASQAANKPNREAAREHPVRKGKKVDAPQRAENSPPPPVAQRPGGLFGAIRRIFTGNPQMPEPR